jgi:hypothetical protein
MLVSVMMAIKHRKPENRVKTSMSAPQMHMIAILSARRVPIMMEASLATVRPDLRLIQTMIFARLIAKTDQLDIQTIQLV